MDVMMDALCEEINLTDVPASTHIDTIYFGGGTPSLLSTAMLDLIFAALHQKFTIAASAEITLEANPDDINPDKLFQWKQSGINRLSVGLQSFDDAELAWMNRAHNSADSLRCLDEIHDAGFINFSIDLIYGSPLLTNETWKKNVAIVLEKKIPHISCYALTVEPSTALFKMIEQHKKAPVDAEKQATQFLLLMQWMEQAGYEQYEISNFCKPGSRSLHNSSYWQGKHYYGFGPSAHSFDGKKRKWNIANNALYTKAILQGNIPAEEETLTETQQLNEYIMTSLRTSEGTHLRHIENKFGDEKSRKLYTALQKWIVSKKLVVADEKIILTTEGKLFADGIAADLFFLE